MLTNFKNSFDYIIIKKGNFKKYRIDKTTQPKFLQFMKSQNYVSNYFFLNKIKDNKKARRALIIKEKFRTIISDCISIREERKDIILNCLSSMRNVKWGFDLNFFLMINIILFGYFNPGIMYIFK